MVCIYCGGKTSVINSRSQRRSKQTWRRRKCVACGAIFSTLETVDFGRSLSVIHKAGHLEPFSRDKLFLSIHSACGHRKDAESATQALTGTIVGQLIAKIKDGQLQRNDIVTTSLAVLKRFDKAASVQYGAYHLL